VVTEDEELKMALGEEVAWLKKDTRLVEMKDFERAERRVPLKVRIALWLVGILGGQL
jgi:CDP-diacylglycerol--glycerol-3-phosphate 3-phosphatidyltransferase